MGLFLSHPGFVSPCSFGCFPDVLALFSYVSWACFPGVLGLSSWCCGELPGVLWIFARYAVVVLPVFQINFRGDVDLFSWCPGKLKMYNCRRVHAAAM